MSFRTLRKVLVAATIAIGLTSDACIAAPENFVQELSDADVAIYKQIFAAAAAGDKEQVLALSAQVKNRKLMGHVAAKGYLSPKTVASFDELKAWLKSHQDYPEAARIYALALRKDATRGRELSEPPRRIP